MEIKDRFAEILEKESLKSARFAEIINVQPSSVSHILSGRNKPSLDFIHKIVAGFPRINVDWLITGQEPMYKYEKPIEPVLFSQDVEELEEVNMLLQAPKLKKTIDTPSIADNSSSIFDMDAIKSGKKIEKVVVFYSDKTFTEYNPS